MLFRGRHGIPTVLRGKCNHRSGVIPLLDRFDISEFSCVGENPVSSADLFDGLESDIGDDRGSFLEAGKASCEQAVIGDIFDVNVSNVSWFPVFPEIVVVDRGRVFVVVAIPLARRFTHAPLNPKSEPSYPSEEVNIRDGCHLRCWAS